MTDSKLITDVRLTALEAIVQKILANQFSQLPPAQSQAVRQQMAETCAKIDVFEKTALTAVDTKKMALLEAHVESFFQIVGEREKDIRQRSNLPPMDR